MARAPLSDNELREIARRLAEGESATALSREFHTTRAAIYQAGGDIGGSRLQMQDEVQRNADAIDLAVWALAVTANEPEWPADQPKDTGQPGTFTKCSHTPDYCVFVQRIDAERARRNLMAPAIASRWLTTGELWVEGVRVEPNVAEARASVKDAINSF